MHWWRVLWIRFEHDRSCSALLLKWLGWHSYCRNRHHRFHRNDRWSDRCSCQWHHIRSLRKKTHHHECSIHLLSWLLRNGCLTIDQLPHTGPLHHGSKHWMHSPNRPSLPVRDGSSRDSRTASCYLCNDDHHQSVLLNDPWPHPWAPLALDVRLDHLRISRLLDLPVLLARVT